MRTITGGRDKGHRLIGFVFSCWLVLLERTREGEFHFGKWLGVRVPSPSPRSIDIIQLAGNLRENLGAQELRGKILSRKGLGPMD